MNKLNDAIAMSVLTFFCCTAVAFGSHPKLSWLPDLQNGLSRAQQEGKSMFVDVSADWCPYCREMDKNVLHDSQVIEFLSQYVTVRLDYDSAAGQSLKRRYSIKGVPCIMLFNSNGQLLGKSDGAPRSSADFIQCVTGFSKSDGSQFNQGQNAAMGQSMGQPMTQPGQPMGQPFGQPSGQWQPQAQTPPTAPVPEWLRPQPPLPNSWGGNPNPGPGAQNAGQIPYGAPQTNGWSPGAARPLPGYPQNNWPPQFSSGQPQQNQWAQPSTGQINSQPVQMPQYPGGQWSPQTPTYPSTQQAWPQQRQP